MPVASLGSIALAAGLVALRGERWTALVLFALLAPVAGSALVDGLRLGVATAVVAAASFNFFHLAPYGVLELGIQELAWAPVFVVPALLPRVPTPGNKPAGNGAAPTVEETKRSSR